MYHTTYNIQHALQRLLQGCSFGGRVSYIKHTYYQTPHLGENAKQESKCHVRNPWVQGNTAIHGTPGDGGLLSPHGSRNYACVVSIPDLP